MEDLKELVTQFEKIYIQTHNYPDSDAIASAYGLKKVIESFAKQAEIIYYGGQIKKPNLNNLIKEYNIKLSLIGKKFSISKDDLLIVVDGQYGEGNVVDVKAENIAVVDHHLEEGNTKVLYKNIQPRIGACATIIVDYIQKYEVEMDQALATALYFGMYVDTGAFNTKMTVLDADNKKFLEQYYDKNFFDNLRLSTLTFNDIKLCAEGMLNTERYNNLLFSQVGDCEDNLLGHTSDLLSEIDGIDIVVIYSVRESGYKISIRSYHDYITAQDLIIELVKKIGNGGGHPSKAGGFISKDKFKVEYNSISFDLFIRTKLIDYYRDLRLLVTSKDNPYQIYGQDKFFKAKKKSNFLRYLNLGDYFSNEVTVKTLEGVETASPEDKLIIGLKNEVWPITTARFNERYEIVNDKTIEADCDKLMDDYGVTLHSEVKTHKITKDNIEEYNICKSCDNVIVDAMKLEENIKVRTSWGDQTGRVGDYLIVIDLDDYYIFAQDLFDLSYQIL